jgi:hypothetical protein
MPHFSRSNAEFSRILTKDTTLFIHQFRPLVVPNTFCFLVPSVIKLSDITDFIPLILGFFTLSLGMEENDVTENLSRSLELRAEILCLTILSANKL